MLQQILAILAQVCIMIGIIFIILSLIFAPKIIRFLAKADDVIHLYDLIRPALDKNYNKIEIKYIGFKKYKFECDSVEELSIAYEKIIKEALERYDKIDEIFKDTRELVMEENKLISILHEIRMLRWEKQE